MKKNSSFMYGALAFLLLFLTVPAICADFDDMEILGTKNFPINTDFRQQWYPHPQYNSIDNEFLVAYRSDGKLTEDCVDSDEPECADSYHSIDGQRISNDGDLIGSPLQWHEPQLGAKHVARLAYNEFNNDYLLTYCAGIGTSNRSLYLGHLDNTGTLLSGPDVLDEPTKDSALLPDIIL